jgi:hypothetical protein
MSRHTLRLLPLIGLLATLGIGTGPALAQEQSTIEFSVANPSPGDTIHVGGNVLEGMALDTAADAGTGIEAIDIFLGDRDSGGTIIGHGTFDLTTVSESDAGAMVVGSPDEPGMWNALVTLPTNKTGANTLWFYVHSAISGQEMAISIPVTVAP